MKHAVDFVAEAWNNVTESTILHSWANLLDTKELVPSPEEEITVEVNEIIKILSKLPSKKYKEMVPTDQIVDWILNDDSKSGKFLSTDEIILKVNEMMEKQSCSQIIDEDAIDIDEMLEDIEEFYNLNAVETTPNENVDQDLGDTFRSSSSEVGNESSDSNCFQMESSEMLDLSTESLGKPVQTSGSTLEVEGQSALNHLQEIEKFCIRFSLDYTPLTSLRQQILEKMYL